MVGLTHTFRLGDAQARRALSGLGDAGLALGYRLDDAQAQRALAGLVEAGTDMTELMDDIGAAMVTSTQLRFEDGEAPDGSKWTPSIRAREEGGKTLVDSSHLMDSITHSASATQVEWGTNVLYAAVHQLGKTIKPKTQPYLRFKIGDRWSLKKQVTIPARPFVGLSDEDKDVIRERVTGYLREAVR